MSWVTKRYMQEPLAWGRDNQGAIALNCQVSIGNVSLTSLTRFLGRYLPTTVQKLAATDA